VSQRSDPAGTPRRRVLVVGAGIGGLTAALALSQRGFEVHIIERAEAFSEIGAGIQLSPNATSVLLQLGLGEALAAVAVEPSAIVVRSGLTGAALAALPGAIFRARYGTPYLVIHRADLQQVLLDAARRQPSVELHLGVSSTAHIDGNGEVRILGGALSEESFDAVIGADGVRSTMRGLVPGGLPFAFADRTAWRALATAGAVGELASPDVVSAWLGPAGHLVCYPVRGGADVNLVAVVEEVADHPGWGVDGDRLELARCFGAWSPRVRSLVAIPERWQKFSLMRVDASGSWVHGRLALLGDAAHAMLPFLAQGAAMAIEDAAVIAHRLSSTIDVASALKGYEMERKSRVARVAAAATLTGNRYHFTGAMAAVRDLALRVAGERLILGEVDWIYRWRPTDG